MRSKITRRDLLKLLAGAAGIGGAAQLSRLLKTPPVEADGSSGNIYLPFISRSGPAAGPYDPNPPVQTQRLIFIHHSTGQLWLADNSGQLGLALKNNNYFVSDTNYGWGPGYTGPGGGTIGDHTDIGNWYDWFLGPYRDTYLAALYQESEQHCSYSRLAANPGGDNAIIMFKSCFPNSNISGNPTDPPTTGTNPIWSQSAGSPTYTMANVKGLYNDLLAYFSSRLDKLFIVITAPPLVQSATSATSAANARAVNTWLVNNWLANYLHKNVAVFDFYNVLTSNGGSTTVNDAGQASGNHHRYRNNAIEYITNQGSNFSQYGASSSDSHPTPAGGQKASMEFLPLLNIYYHRWKL